MPAFQNTREHTEQKVLVQLLSEIEKHPSFTQRSLASELGIALGLMNQYLKRCITKGWIRASQVSPRRITYFLTPEGFKEKSQMVTDYLARSLSFFRDARSQCEEVFTECASKGWKKLALIGSGDLADIAKLVAHAAHIQVTLETMAANLTAYDAVLITDIESPQFVYDQLKSKVEEDRLLILRLLHISRQFPAAEKAA